MNAHHSHRPGTRCCLALLLPLLLGARPLPALERPAPEPQAFTGVLEARLASPELPALLRALAPGAMARVGDVGLEGGERVALALTRFQVFAPGAQIVVHGDRGDRVEAPPDAVYLRGTVEGEPGSVALVVVEEPGEVRGFLTRGGALHMIASSGPGLAGGVAAARRVDAELEGALRAASFRCGAESLPFTGASPLGLAPAPEAAAATYQADVAIETDHELFTVAGGSSARVTTYVGDLIAGASAIYVQDLNTTLQIAYLSVWETGSDPWNATSTTCMLYQVGNYWEAIHPGVARDLVHFLGGRDLGGGIAWLSTLCDPAFTTSSAGCAGLPPSSKGGAYGVSTGLEGGWDRNNPSVVWDIVVVAHEIGHNFGSPHTHCYGDYPNPGAQPVDQCFSGEGGCYSGPESVPTGGGTLMSYCHQQSGGLDNIRLTFGQVGSYGTDSQRVPQRMRAVVESVAGACLTPVAGYPEEWSSFFAVDLRETPFTGDFDGDGRTDIITFTRDNPSAFGDVYVSLSDGTRFGPSNKWHDFFAINQNETVVIGDYDGDGRDDIATWLGSSSRQVYVATSFGSGMNPEQVWLGSIGLTADDPLFAGDANGDGRDDLITFARSTGTVRVALSTGSAFQSPLVWHTFFAVSTYERPRVGDVDGDGRADIITFATDSPTAFGDVYVALSTGIKFGDGQNSDKWHDFFSINPSEIIRIGDRDGDAKDDFFTVLPRPWNQVYTVQSLGTGMGPNVLAATLPLTREPEDLFFVGDATGDGKADLVQFARSRHRVFVLRAP